jgi:hypothetical protein
VIIRNAFSQPGYRCGVGLPPEASTDIGLASGVIVQTCRTSVGHTTLGRLMPIGHWLTVISGILFLISPLVLLALRRWRLLALMFVPYTFFALYLALHAGIDRYGMPLYPFGVAAGVAAALSISDAFRAKRAVDAAAAA